MNRATALAFFAAIGGAVPACGLSQQGVSPPDDTFFYPASAVTFDQDRWLYVTNSNADLRFNNGTLLTVDLTAAAADRASTNWEDCPMGDYVKSPRGRSEPSHYCCRDRIDANVLNCDERAYIPADRTVQIGSFAAGMQVQGPGCPEVGPGQDPCNCNPTPAVPRDSRLYIAVRGNTSLTWANLLPDDPPRVGCNNLALDTGRTFYECDADHRIVHTEFLPPPTFPEGVVPTEVALPAEPYALALDPQKGLLYLGHLTGSAGVPFTGGFSLFDVAPVGDEIRDPRYVAPFPPPFPANASGLVGITSLTWLPDRNGGQILATSRYVPQATGLSALTPQCAAGTSDLPAFSNGDTFDTGLVGAETRGIQFIGDHAFVLQRSPPALVELDANRTPVKVLETCSAPTFLYKHNPYGKDVVGGTRLFVNCYDVGEVYIFDPSVAHLEKTLQVGRGPAGMVFPESTPTVAYVVGFGDNNVSVLDLDPASPTFYHVTQRIGFPTQVPR